MDNREVVVSRSPPEIKESKHFFQQVCTAKYI